MRVGDMLAIPKRNLRAVNDRFRRVNLTGQARDRFLMVVAKAPRRQAAAFATPAEATVTITITITRNRRFVRFSAGGSEIRTFGPAPWRDHCRAALRDIRRDTRHRVRCRATEQR